MKDPGDRRALYRLLPTLIGAVRPLASGHPAMRFSINIPTFGDFADPGAVAAVASAAEQAGWDGLFVWDHLLHRRHPRPYGDPWMLLTAAALATSGSGSERWSRPSPGGARSS